MLHPTLHIWMPGGGGLTFLSGNGGQFKSRKSMQQLYANMMGEAKSRLKHCWIDLITLSHESPLWFKHDNLCDTGPSSTVHWWIYPMQSDCGRAPRSKDVVFMWLWGDVVSPQWPGSGLWTSAPCSACSILRSFCEGKKPETWKDGSNQKISTCTCDMRILWPSGHLDPLIQPVVSLELTTVSPGRWKYTANTASNSAFGLIGWPKSYSVH